MIKMQSDVDKMKMENELIKYKNKNMKLVENIILQK